MTKRATLRSRLLVSLVLVAAGTLAVAGAATVLLVRRGAADAAMSDLRHKAANIQASVELLRQQIQAAQAAARAPRKTFVLRDSMNQLRSAVRVSDARLIIVLADGSVATQEDLQATPRGRAFLGADGSNASFVELPAGLTAQAIRTDALLQGSTVSVRQTNAVYYAQPITDVGAALGTPVIVLSQEIDNQAARRAFTAFVLAAVIALLACIVVATWLAARLARPLAAIDRTAKVLAAGDLTARVPIAARTDAEVADVAMTLNRMAADLDAARGAERSFLQAVSHDLRTPLTSIRGYAEALADGTLDAARPEDRQKAASVIGAEARRLERLVRDLLDLSRLDSREFSLRPRPCDAAAIVRDTAAGFAPQAAELGIQLSIVTDTPVSCDLDAERLGQIVANLVENALKYAQERVDVTVSADASWFAVTISDDGPGIAPADQARVFERLYTGRGATPRAVGTGLGLAIVHELARAMGGEARLASSGATGTTFAVRIRR